VLCGWVTKPSKTRHHEGNAFEMGSIGGGERVGWVVMNRQKHFEVDPFLCFRKRERRS